MQYTIPQNIFNYIKTQNFVSWPSFRADNKDEEFNKWKSLYSKDELKRLYYAFNYNGFSSNECSWPLCQYCGNELSLDQVKHYIKFCTPKCRSNSDQRKNNFTKTCQQKFGVSNPSKLSERRDWFKQNNPAKRLEIRQKMSNVARNRTSDEIADIVKKRKQTYIEKYGTENVSQSDWFQEKSKQTCMQKYGVPYASQSHDRFLKNRSHNYASNKATLAKRRITIVSTFEQYCSCREVTYRCDVCGRQWTVAETSPDRIRCINRHGKVTSYEEQDVLNYIKSIYSGEINNNIRTLLEDSQLELDIYLPSLKIGIEFNGSYYHRTYDGSRVDMWYHQQKSLKFLKEGIRVFQIFEYDWINNRDKILNDISQFVLQQYRQPITNKINLNEFMLLPPNAYKIIRIYEPRPMYIKYNNSNKISTLNGVSDSEMLDYYTIYDCGDIQIEKI